MSTSAVTLVEAARFMTDKTLSKEEKIATVARFLTKSPPGQVSDVFKDIRQLVNDDEALDSGIKTALVTYNEEQLITTTLGKQEVLISQHGALEQGRYLDPTSSQSFAFDHFTLKASDIKPFTLNESTEATRKQLEKGVLAYVDDHYTTGVAAVYAPRPVQEDVEMETATPAAMPATAEEETAAESDKKHEEEAPEDIKETTDETETKEEAEAEEAKVEDAAEDEKLEAKKEETVEESAAKPAVPTSPPPTAYHITIVDNRYKLNAFWTGRWRSTWSFDDNKLTGTISVNVHYYEDGNVQLATSKKVEVDTDASAVSKHIASAEQEYQRALNIAYSDLSEQTFKSLRRALPLTKQKVDWDKISSYKLGVHLSQ